MAKLTTNNSPNDYWTYGYPVEQHPISKDAIIVGLYDAFQETVLFYGIISGKKVSRFPIVTSNSYAGYQYYTPNHEFTYGDLNKDIIGIIQQYFL